MVRVWLELGLGVGLGASKLLIAECRYAIHGNRVPVAGTGYTTENMDCSTDTNASATIGKSENAENCYTSLLPYDAAVFFRINVDVIIVFYHLLYYLFLRV